MGHVDDAIDQQNKCHRLLRNGLRIRLATVPNCRHEFSSWSRQHDNKLCRDSSRAYSSSSANLGLSAGSHLYDRRFAWFIVLDFPTEKSQQSAPGHQRLAAMSIKVPIQYYIYNNLELNKC